MVTPPFVHCTEEHGRKFVPVSVSVAPELPAVALAGEIEAMAGAASPEGAVTEKSTVFEVAEPMLGIVSLKTAIGIPGAALASAMSETEISAVSCVELTKVVGRPEPDGLGGGLKSQITVEPFTKFDPFTVNVIPEAVQDGAEGGDKDVMAGELILKDWHGTPAGVMLNTSTQAF